jgi:molybdate transport system regulatory protein
MRLSLRIDFDKTTRLGPGKAELLERIAEHGSISAAGRAMDMSYRRAWKLVDALNSMFSEKLVVAQTGGTGGGKAALTPAGAEVLRLYRAIEAHAASDRALLEKLSLLLQRSE